MSAKGKRTGIFINGMEVASSIAVNRTRQVMLSAEIEYARLITMAADQDHRRADRVEIDGNSQAINHSAL